MVLPTFLVIGAMKAGTTSLHSYLAAHPDVFVAAPKELNYFVAGKNWERGRSWYEERFAPGEAATARGEASPDYTKADVFPGVPARVAALVPDARLVYLVRHPIERMRSMYLHEVAAGRETLPIGDALRADPHYLNTSRYAWQLDHYLEHFAADQILVVTSDDLRHRRHDTLARVAGFLGVDASVPAGDAVSDERGRTTDKHLASPVVARLRRSPPIAAVARVAPAPVRRFARGVGRRPLPAQDATIDAALEAELVELLAPDVARLRRFLSAGFDGWQLG